MDFGLDSGEQLGLFEYEKSGRRRIMWVPDLRRRTSVRGRDSHDPAGRRKFIKLGAGLAGAALFGRGAAQANDAFPPQDAPWSQIARPRHRRPPLWPALAIRQGRDPPQRSLAHRQPGILGQLHAAAGPAPASSPPTGCSSSAITAAAPTVDPQQHRLMIHGLVERPLLLTMEDIKRFPVGLAHSLSSSARPMAAWSGARRSSTRCNSPTAW